MRTWICGGMSIVVAVALASVVGFAQRGASAPRLVFTHVTVIDATGAAPQADVTVRIEGGRIVSLDRSGTPPPSADALVVDGTGKFLIPGLWDMHAHETQKFLPVFVANGVTGVRDMAGGIQARKDVALGTAVGPRIIASGPGLDGPNAFLAGFMRLKTVERAREAVGLLKYRGADFVKVFHFLPRDLYFAIADEAKKEGMPFAGHVPFAVMTAEASDAGQKSMEHLEAVIFGCSEQEADVRSEITKAMTGFEGSPADWERRWTRYWLRSEEKALDSYSETRAAALFARFVRNGTWQTSTIVLRAATADRHAAAVTERMRLEFIPQYIRNNWIRETDDLDDAGLGDPQRVLVRSLEIVGALHRAGVELLAGTDSPNLYLVPGESLHDELLLLVRAGLTPLEALQTATRNPAKFVGMLDRLGTIEVGKTADLVLLGANPLDDIRNTRRIAGVVLGGRLFAPADLKKLVADAVAANTH